MNGTGYPFGLKADEISRAARMGAICDIYDALTSHRPYKRGWGTARCAQGHGGLGRSSRSRAAVFRFMQSIGMFVPGALVELRSRRLGVILPQGARTGIMQARAFFDLQARDFIEPEDVRLGESLRFDQAMRLADPARFGFTDWGAMQAAILAGHDPRPAGGQGSLDFALIEAVFLRTQEPRAQQQYRLAPGLLLSRAHRRIALPLADLAP